MPFAAVQGRSQGYQFQLGSKGQESKSTNSFDITGGPGQVHEGGYQHYPSPAHAAEVARAVAGAQAGTLQFNITRAAKPKGAPEDDGWAQIAQPRDAMPPTIA